MRKIIYFTALMLFTFLSCAPKPELPYEVDRFPTPGGREVAITFIKHGSVAISLGNFEIQVDPVLNQRNFTVDYSVFPKADLILITHEHGDHLDSAAIAMLSQKNTRIILNQKSRDIFGAGEVISNGEELQINKQIQLEAVPAYNSTPERSQFHPKGNGNGYLLTLDGFKIYIAGDTEFIPEMENLADREIDVAFLPVNQPYTMTIEQCVQAAEVIRPKILYPYHFSNTPVEQIADSLSGSGIEVRIRAM